MPSVFYLDVQKGGANWNKQRMKVARTHERIKNARTVTCKTLYKDHKNHDVIGIEDLQVSNILQESQTSESDSKYHGHNSKRCCCIRQAGMGEKSDCGVKNIRWFPNLFALRLQK